MSRVKYVYNPKTLQYEKLSLTRKEIFIKSFGYGLTLLFTSGLIFLLAYLYFPTPKEKLLQREIEQMQYTYSLISEDVELLSKDLDGLHQKDQEVHRMIFGLPQIDSSVWLGGIGGTDRHQFLTKYDASGEMLESSLDQVEQLERKMGIQRKSLEEIYALAVMREKKLASVPSIKPVKEGKLKRKIKHLSGFGYRIHPVHKVKKFHKGIDFTAPTGTAIQATGNGVVERVEKKKRGYGVNVIINHGFGYKTLYAHMNEVFVKKGEQVVRGHKIGTIGNTGTSTAPHLHYEVRINGKAVNPIDYCMDGLSPAEYQELLNKSEVENQSFD